MAQTHSQFGSALKIQKRARLQATMTCTTLVCEPSLWLLPPQNCLNMNTIYVHVSVCNTPPTVFVTFCQTGHVQKFAGRYIRVPLHCHLLISIIFNGQQLKSHHGLIQGTGALHKIVNIMQLHGNTYVVCVHLFACMSTQNIRR